MCIVQGVPCVLHNMCSVQGVECVFYKVCSVYCTSQPVKSSVNKEDFNIKSNII